MMNIHGQVHIDCPGFVYQWDGSDGKWFQKRQ